jgi:hypothetical protein
MKKTRSRRTPKRKKPFRHPKAAKARVTFHPPLPELSLATAASLTELVQMVARSGLMTPPASPRTPKGPAELARLVQEREA